MDEGQKNAIKQCFIKKLALIKGPPGSGKTFIAKIVAKIIVELKRYTDHFKNPVLVIAKTNHALDAYLAEIYKID